MSLFATIKCKEEGEQYYNITSIGPIIGFYSLLLNLSAVAKKPEGRLYVTSGIIVVKNLNVQYLGRRLIKVGTRFKQKYFYGQFIVIL